MLSRHLEDFYRIFSQMSLVFFEAFESNLFREGCLAQLCPDKRQRFIDLISNQLFPAPEFPCRVRCAEDRSRNSY